MPILEERPQKETIKQSVKDITDKVPDIQTRIDRTIAYYESTSRLQWFRMIALDLALPLTVAIIALWKVYALVLPMISTIWSA